MTLVYSETMYTFGGCFYFKQSFFSIVTFGSIFNTIIPSTFVGYEMVITNEMHSNSMAIIHPNTQKLCLNYYNSIRN